MTWPVMTKLHNHIIYTLCKKNISSSKQLHTEGGFGGFKTPENPKVLQNHAKPHLIVKTVQNCWI